MVRRHILIDGEINPEDNPRKVNGRLSIGVATKRSPKPMRLFERLFIVCLFALTLGVFCSEVPELISLNDDSSDDFVTSSSLPARTSIQTVQQVSTAQRRLVPIAARSCLSINQSPERFFLAGTDLLRLLSTQQK